MTYVIESDIPIPDRRGGPPVSELTKTLMRMTVGQSIFVPGLVSAQMGGRMQRVRQTGRKFVIRNCEGGCRVWRVE